MLTESAQKRPRAAVLTRPVVANGARGVGADGELAEPEEGQLQLWLIYAPEGSSPTESAFRDLLDAGAIYVANYSRPAGYEEAGQSVGDYKRTTVRGTDAHLVQRSRPEFDIDWRDIWWRESGWPGAELDLWVSVSGTPALVTEADHQALAERLIPWQ